MQPDLPLVQLADGRCIFTQARADSPTDLREILIYDPRSTTDKLRRKTLAQAVAAQPAAFGEGLLVPAKIGQVLLIDPDTGRNLIEPFQPIVEVGLDVAWTEPAVFADKQALISDGADEAIPPGGCRLAAPHLEAAATVDLAVPLVSTMAVAGDFAYGVDTGNRLISFRLPDLAPAKDWPLDARAVWGPLRVGNHVLVATLSGQLSCVDGAGELAWQVPLGPGCVVGSPLESRGEIVAGSTTGTVYRIAPDSGKVLTEVALGQPLALGPVRWHDRLLFAGSDGTLHVVAEPEVVQSTVGELWLETPRTKTGRRTSLPARPLARGAADAVGNCCPMRPGSRGRARRQAGADGPLLRARAVRPGHSQ